MKIRRAKILGFTVLLAGLALGGIGLWLLFGTLRYQAVIRLRSYPYSLPESSESPAYDENFVPIEIEAIKSEAVLRRVVTNLNLNELWTEKHADGRKLELGQPIHLLKKRVKVQATPRKFDIDIKISVTSNDPSEAAKIANAVAQAYRNYRLDQWRQLEIQGIQMLTEYYQKQEEEIRRVQTNVNFLRQECRITNDVPPPQSQQEWLNKETVQPEHHAALPGQAYGEEKRRLEEMLEFQKLLADKINSAKACLNLCADPSLVQILDLAMPPESPIGPNRLLGALLLALGLCLATGGMFFLKMSRRPSA